MTLEWIIDFAYDFHRSELVSGLPDWAKNDRYDITAKVTGPDLAAFSKADARPAATNGPKRCSQTGFHLKVHREPI